MTVVIITDTTKSGFGDTGNQTTWALAHDAASSASVSNGSIVAQWYRT